MDGLCIGVDEFKAKYPQAELIKQGAYGKIYLSGDYIVKVQDMGAEFIKEVCILEQFKHPNICPIANIAFGIQYSYIALPKGQSVYEAYTNGEITIPEIITDILGGLNQLNSHGVVHADLKIQNCIYHEGRVKIIDLGISKFTEYIQYNNDSPEDYFDGPAYTEMFRDPEYNSNKLVNPINVELYSLVMTIYYMLTNKYYIGKERPYYIDMEQWKSLGLGPDTIDFLMLCQTSLDERPNIKTLYDHPVIIRERFEASINNPPATYTIGNILDYQGFNDTILYVLNDWLLQITSLYRYSPRIYFLTCDMLCRYILEEKIKLSDLQTVATACFYLAVCLLGTRSIYVNDLKHICGGTSDDFLKIICHIITTLKGRLFNYTLYDTITTQDQMKNFCAYIANRNYTSGMSYEFPDSQILINRSVPLNYKDYIFYIKNSLLFVPEDIDPIPYRGEPIPIQQPVDTDLTTLENVVNPKLGQNPMNYYNDIISTTARNLKLLPDITETNAYFLFYKLLNNAVESNSYELLHRCVLFEPRFVTLKTLQEHKQVFLKHNIFTITQDEMDQILFEFPFSSLEDFSGEFEDKKIITPDELLLRLSNINNLLNSGQLKPYSFTNGFDSLEAHNKYDAVINLLNHLRAAEPDIWSKETNAFNKVFSGDIEAWVDSLVE